MRVIVGSIPSSSVHMFVCVSVCLSIHQNVFVEISSSLNIALNGFFFLLYGEKEIIDQMLLVFWK